jgi:hypothetical protein
MKMLILKNLLCLLGILSCQNNAEKLHHQTTQTIEMNDAKHLEVNGMTIDWQHRNDRVFFSLSAPTEGWVTLGFNEKDDIVGTNLIFCRVISGKVEVADHFVVGMGNHQPTEKVGGTSVFKDISGEEKGGKTTVSFSMPVEASDKFHFDLTRGTSKWFICAFSAEDDFYHHSRMREHRQVKL